jgi:hypothetical protein
MSMKIDYDFLPGTMIAFNVREGEGFLFESPGYGSEFMETETYERLNAGDSALVLCRMHDTCSRDILGHKLLVLMTSSRTIAWTWSKWWRCV